MMGNREKRTYVVTSNPIVRQKRGTRDIMLDVIIALIPTMAFGVYNFGVPALTVILVAMVSSAFFEWAYRKLLHKSNTLGDCSALVTGAILAMALPPSSPWWMVVIGSFFAIVFVKQLYGGLGKNFLNPALAGRAFLTASYAGHMTNWVIPRTLTAGFAADATTMATPLAYLYSGEAMPEYYSRIDMMLGHLPGSIGEVCTIAILLGGAYLLIRKVITWHIPVSFIGTVAVLCLIFGHEGYGRIDWMGYNIFAGGLIFGAFFMANDYSCSPVVPEGQIIYGIGCGIITVLIRYFGSYPEGVTYAILVMNLCTWAIDKLTKRYQFGVSKEDIKAMKQAKKEAKKAAKEEGGAA
jgi:electron transport complex protein RnfD